MLTPTGALCPQLGYPCARRGKTTYFIKKSAVSLDGDDFQSVRECVRADFGAAVIQATFYHIFKQVLLFGDVSSHHLGSFNVIMDEIFAPLLNNSMNQMWPKLLRDDIASKFHDVGESVAVVLGNLNNKTYLPLPINISEVLEKGERILAELVIITETFLLSIVMNICYFLYS